jgi:hypothetical protein
MPTGILNLTPKQQTPPAPAPAADPQPSDNDGATN